MSRLAYLVRRWIISRVKSGEGSPFSPSPFSPPHRGLITILRVICAFPFYSLLIDHADSTIHRDKPVYIYPRISNCSSNSRLLLSMRVCIYIARDCTLCHHFCVSLQCVCNKFSINSLSPSICCLFFFFLSIPQLFA